MVYRFGTDDALLLIEVNTMNTELVRLRHRDVLQALRIIQTAFELSRENVNAEFNTEYRGGFRQHLLDAIESLEAAALSLPLGECERLERQAYETAKALAKDRKINADCEAARRGIK